MAAGGRSVAGVLLGLLFAGSASCLPETSVAQDSGKDAATMVQASVHLHEDVELLAADPAHAVLKRAIQPKKVSNSIPSHPAKVDNSEVVVKAKHASAAQPRAEGEHNMTVHRLSSARPVVRGKFAKPDAKATELAVVNSTNQDADPIVQPEVNMSRGNISVRFEHTQGGARENCSFAWGDEMNLTLLAHIPSGFRKGDRVAFSLSTLMSADSTSPMASLLRSSNFSARIDAACELCEGSCRHVVEMASGDSLNLTTPSLLRGTPWCNETGMVREGQETYNFRQLLTLPAEMGAFWLGANLTLAVVGEDGLERAATTSSVALGNSLPELEKASLTKPEGHHKDKNEHHKEPKHEHHQNDKTKHHHHEQPASMLEIEQENLERMRTALRQVRTLQGPFEMGKALLYASASTVAFAAAEASEGDLSLAAASDSEWVSTKEEGLGKDVGQEEGFPEKVMILDVNLLEIENGSSYNFSFAADPGCETVNPDTGSFRCRLGFGHQVTTAASLHLSSTFDPGSWLKITVSVPKLSGFMGSLVKSMFQNMHLDEPIQLPLCGEAFTLKLAGQQMDVPERLCGFYAMDLLQPGRNFTVIGADELHQIKIPGVNARIPDINMMPDMTVATRFETFHANGEKVLDVIVTSGLGKVWREG